MYRLAIVCLLLALFAPLWGIEEEEAVPAGNYAVSPRTQVGPLISFGQTLIGQNAFFPQVYSFFQQGPHNYSSVIAPSAIYGIRDDLALFLFAPISLRNRGGPFHSSGMNDTLLQVEYGYYSLSRKEYSLQGTVLAAVQFPTGSSSKQPPTGAGWFSYFLGTTFAYLSDTWYAFVSPGVNIPTARHGTKEGVSYLYQWGIARYIAALSPQGWVFNLMVEFDGTYNQRSKVGGSTNPNSGGNVLFITPSICLASETLFIQFGVGWPAIQQLNGHQTRIAYAIASNVGAGIQF